MKRDFFREYAILPQDTVYLLPTGPLGKRNNTIIQTLSGETMVPLHIKTVLKKYYMLSNIHQNFVRSVVCECTRKKILYPIPIRPNLVLIPVKTRLKDSQDSAYGYVNLSFIRKIIKSSEPETSSRILFQNHIGLSSPQNIRSLEHNYICAKYVQNHYFSKCAEAGIVYESLEAGVKASPEWER